MRAVDDDIAITIDDIVIIADDISITADDIAAAVSITVSTAYVCAVVEFTTGDIYYHC